MADIAPELWEAIERDMLTSMEADAEFQKMIADYNAGRISMDASYPKFAMMMNLHLSRSLQKNLGKQVYIGAENSYNIAKEILDKGLTFAHESIADMTAAAIKLAHEKAGMGIKAIKPPVDQDRIDGLAKKFAEAESEEEAKKVLGSPIENFALHSADATVEANAELVNGLGRECFIIRIDAKGCCKWCREIAGRYKYSKQTPKDVFRRHENCNCQVLYDDGNGPYEDVHRKELVYDPAKRQAEIESERRPKRTEKGVELERKLESELQSIIPRKDPYARAAEVKVKSAISYISNAIRARGNEKGRPSAIAVLDVDLNKKQKALLEQLTGYDSKVIVSKKAASMKDLAALTAKTGVEFAMFTKGNDRLIIRGNAVKVNVGVNYAKELAELGYKWSGHTHPGTTTNSLIASRGDLEVLKAFGQKESSIFNSKGQYAHFGEGE